MTGVNDTHPWGGEGDDEADPFLYELRDVPGRLGLGEDAGEGDELVVDDVDDDEDEDLARRPFLPVSSLLLADEEDFRLPIFWARRS